MGRRKDAEDEAKPGGLDIGQLAYLVGMAADEAVMGRMRGEGFLGLRPSHGLLLSHLVSGARSVTELAELLGASPHTTSKRVAELTEHGYLEHIETDDGGEPSVQLSERGQACVAAARAARRSLEGDLREVLGDGAVASAKKVLRKALEQLGGPEVARPQRTRSPR